MRPTDYGQIPVIIRRATRGKKAGVIALIYDVTEYYSKTTMVVELNTKKKYTPVRTKLSVVRYYYSNKHGGQAVSIKEAKEWLTRYCSYHRMNPMHFKVVSSFGKAQNGFYEMDLVRGRGENYEGLS